MDKKFLIRRKIYIIKKVDNESYKDLCYKYYGNYKLMNQKIMGKILAYEHVPLSIYIYRKIKVQVSDAYSIYGTSGFYSFDNCYSIYSNKKLLPSLPRNIIKDYSKAKLSYFKRSILNELDYAENIFYSKYNNGSVLFANTKVERPLSNLVIR